MKQNTVLESSPRAPFSKDLEPLRQTLLELVTILQANTDWYGSVYFERKTLKSYSANLKQTQLSDQFISGIVFRIYNGYTLFEQATDDLTPSNLKKVARDFANQVLHEAPPSEAEVSKKIYHPPTWKQRLSQNLESEITCQISKVLDARTPVHFGIRFIQDPRNYSTAECFESLKNRVNQCKNLASKFGIPSEELTYVLARQNFSIEESIFVDQETNMSQTLYRLNLAVVTMSGPHQTYLRIGGLGGLECIQLPESDLGQLLKDLKSLKAAERLEPGKYRVIFGPALTGVLAHEAFGHSQEGDTCARGRSKAWELYKSQEKVGNQHATILNNPALFNNGGEPFGAWGSYFFDEEGWLSQEQVLLQEGKLLAPMTSLTSAIRLGVPRTANGKRESWTNGVYTRQTNTYFSPGNKTLDELISDLGNGFIALHCAGGMEDPKGMGIQVGISYLEEVKDGKRTGRFFKGPAGGDIQMTGYTPDVLHSIEAKSKIAFNSKENDRTTHPYNDVGGCGKYHKEFVYAGCGGPYILLNNVILG